MAIDQHDDTCTYGARLLSGYVNTFQDQIEGAILGQDIEYVHQLRVYSRRLRCALPVFAQCIPPKSSRKWQKKIKKITQALGKARDLDVQIEALIEFRDALPERKYDHGMQRLILRLSQSRSRVQSNVQKKLETLSASNFLRELRTKLLAMSSPQKSKTPFTAELHRLAYESISQNLHALMQYDEFVADPRYVKELHEMRIAAKNLRYTIEIFAPIYQGNLMIPHQTIRQIQKRLGAIHDCDVWIEFLPGFKLQEKQRILDFYGRINAYNFILPGINYFEESRHALRIKTYNQFRTEWKEGKTNRIWETLIEAIKMPLSPKDALENE